MTTLRQRYIEDLQLRGLSARTQESYVRVVRQLAEHYGKSPEVISEEELRQYLLYLKNEKHAARNTCTLALCSLKFFYQRTLKRDWPVLDFVRPAPATDTGAVAGVRVQPPGSGVDVSGHDGGWWSDVPDRGAARVQGGVGGKRGPQAGERAYPAAFVGDTSVGGGGQPAADPDLPRAPLADDDSAVYPSDAQIGRPGLRSDQSAGGHRRLIDLAANFRRYG